jgi:thioredoxin 1
MLHHFSSPLRSLVISLGLLAVANLALAEAPAKLPKFIDLGADKCIPCKMMMPVMEELTKEYAGQLEVVFYDVWKDHSKGKEYALRVIPTQIFFDASGKEIFRHEGFISKKEILAKWTELGVKLTAPAKTS